MTEALKTGASQAEDRARPADEPVRRQALDTGRSFIVQAPAGSGKTELLIRRLLALLNRADAPEEVVAITFTRKAAAEMRGRVVDALRSATFDRAPSEPHKAETWRLAREVMGRDRDLGWGLLESPNRIRIRTIDALCAEITRRMPLASRFGAQPETTGDADDLYREAALAVLAKLEGVGTEREAESEAVGRLLENEPLRRRLGKAGRQRILSCFRPEDIYAGHVAEYSRLLNERGIEPPTHSPCGNAGVRS